MHRTTPSLRTKVSTGFSVAREMTGETLFNTSLRFYWAISEPVLRWDHLIATKIAKPARTQILQVLWIPRVYIDDNTRSLWDLVSSRIKGLDMLRWKNVQWYGWLTAGWALMWETMHDVADALGIKPNLSVVQLLGLVFILTKVGQRFGARVIDRTDEFHQINREVRQWVSAMIQVIDWALVKEDGTDIEERSEPAAAGAQTDQRINIDKEKTTISDFMLVLITIAESFEHPDSPDFESFFKPGSDISVTTQDPHKAYWEQKKILLCDEVSTFLETTIAELELAKDMISNSDRIEMLTRVKDRLVFYLQAFVRDHIIEWVQGDVYAEISHIHDLIGRYDTNSTEWIKAPEWIFFALAWLYATISFYLPEDHRANTIMWTALLGYFGAMMRDYYYGNSWPTAIDPRDGALNRAKRTITRSNLSNQVWSQETEPPYPTARVDLKPKWENK